MALKNCMKDKLCSLSENIDLVRMEQCNQIIFMEGMKKMLEESKTKIEMIKKLFENVNTIINAYQIIPENKKRDIDKLCTFYVDFIYIEQQFL